MPDEKKKMVPIDTSGPDATIDIEETKDESVVETEAPEERNRNRRTSKTRNRRKETRRKFRRLQ